MDKIFEKILKTSFLGHFWDFLSPLKQSFVSKCLIRTCRRMEKQTVSNLWDTSAGVVIQLVFAPHRHYGLSVSWYILVRIHFSETTVSIKASPLTEGNKDDNKIKIKLE